MQVSVRQWVPTTTTNQANKHFNSVFTKWLESINCFVTIVVKNNALDKWNLGNVNPGSFAKFKTMQYMKRRSEGRMALIQDGTIYLKDVDYKTAKSILPL